MSKSSRVGLLVGCILVTIMFVHWLSNPARQAIDWMKENNYEKAIPAWDKAIKKEPENAKYYCSRGIAWLVRPDEPDSQKALSDLNKAIELSPDLAEAYLARAALYTNRGELQLALADCDKLDRMKCGPQTRALTHNARGTIYCTKNEPAQAITELNKAISSLNSKLAAPAHSSRAIAYAKLQQFDEAMKDVNRAMKYDKSSSYRTLGLVLLLQGKSDEAKTNFRKYREFYTGKEHIRNLQKTITRIEQYVKERALSSEDAQVSDD